jgi:Sulfotransferase family
LGAAYGSSAQWQRSFDQYARANAIRRLGVSHDPDWTSRQAARLKALFTPDFFQGRTGQGCDSRAPIFIVGMQRSGSTLIEQILASHSAIEALGELPDMPRLVDGLADGESQWKNLGERYLASTRHRRTLGRTFFVDKQPYNFWHVGWIHLMLPHARIIDVRRHPLGCCFSNFTKISKHPLPYFHRQSDLGRYYADYAALMAHFDRVLPGRIYRVTYENLVADLQGEVRRLLDHLGLPFEENCLRFHENNRAFDSASNEQVRMPIFSDGIERWRHYEPWLGPLKKALEPVLACYPAAPQSAG